MRMFFVTASLMSDITWFTSFDNSRKRPTNRNVDANVRVERPSYLLSLTISIVCVCLLIRRGNYWLSVIENSEFELSFV